MAADLDITVLLFITMVYKLLCMDSLTVFFMLMDIFSA